MTNKALPTCRLAVPSSLTFRQGLPSQDMKMNQDGQTTYFLGAILLLATQMLSKIQPS